jgi:hypothetical protein
VGILKRNFAARFQNRRIELAGWILARVQPASRRVHKIFCLAYRPAFLSRDPLMSFHLRNIDAATSLMRRSCRARSPMRKSPKNIPILRLRLRHGRDASGDQGRNKAPYSNMDVNANGIECSGHGTSATHKKKAPR